jgi:hypothetical protein
LAQHYHSELRIGANASRVLVLAIVIVRIAYGSTYPFIIRVPLGGTGALHALFTSWTGRVERSDFFANVFFYTPLGFFAYAATSTR